PIEGGRLPLEPRRRGLHGCLRNVLTCRCGPVAGGAGPARFQPGSEPKDDALAPEDGGGIVVCLPNPGDAYQAGCFVPWAVAPVELGTKAPTFPPGWARRRLGLGGTSESPGGTQTLVGCFSGKGGRY